MNVGMQGDPFTPASERIVDLADIHPEHTVRLQQLRTEPG
jgi:hypothetical protein